MEEDLTRFDAILRARGAVTEVDVGNGRVSCIPAQRYCDIGLELLKQDPYIFLKKPPAFRKGEIPWDGITSNRDELSKAGYYAFLAADGPEQQKPARQP